MYFSNSLFNHRVFCVLPNDQGPYYEMLFELRHFRHAALMLILFHYRVRKLVRYELRFSYFVVV